MLELSNASIDMITKRRYYKKLSILNPAFSTPSDTEEFKRCCRSIVNYLRNQTRDNHIVMEENINYGFCKNMNMLKPTGIILCFICTMQNPLQRHADSANDGTVIPLTTA